MNASDAPKKSDVLSAMFLVGGTCIGGGMLALPLATGLGGLIPSLAIMTVCWLAMTITALLFVEVSLWLEEGAHVITMASRILGPVGKAVSWFLFLYISYASLVAYTAGGGLQIADFFTKGVGLPVTQGGGALIFILIFGSIFYLGSRFLGRVNTMLFTALVVAYIALIGMGMDEVNPGFLLHREWNISFIAVPLLLTAFSFQTMVPSLTPFLKRDPKALRRAVVGGAFIAFVIYTIWLTLMLGIIPVDGASSLAEALEKGEPATQFLTEHVDGKWICMVAEYFAFFAIVTSFLGIGLGLFDFLADGLHIKKKGMGNLALGLLVGVPTLFFAVYFERIFLLALDTTGGFGDSILNGIIPVMLVWIGRYKLGYSGPFKVFGGRPFLVIVLSVFCLALILEILAITGIVPSIFEPYDILKIHNERQLTLIGE